MRSILLTLTLAIGCVTARAATPALAPVAEEVLKVVYMGTKPGPDDLLVCKRIGDELPCVEYGYFHEQLAGGDR